MFQFAASAVLLAILSLSAVDAQLPDECNRFTLYDRSSWGGQSVDGLVKADLPFRKVSVSARSGSCTSTEECKQLVKQMQQDDIAAGLVDIAENLLISPAGEVFSARGWDFEGQHTKDFDKFTVGISIIGDYEASGPSDAALQTLNDLIACGKLTDKIAKVYSTNARSDLDCASQQPGAALYSKIKELTNYGGSIC